MTGKVALVTGAANGIGQACAIQLAEDGMAVGVLDLDEARCADTVEAIEAAGGKASRSAPTSRTARQVQAALAKLRAELGPVTVLVNNAGIVDFTDFEQITDEAWDRMFAVNCRGTFIVTQEVLPDMKAAKWGRIVNISSSSAQTGTKVQVHYSASKGAIVSYTRSLAEALGPHGITVNNIPPGSVMGTVMSEANREKFPIPIETLIANMPVRRLGEVADIANACSYLCSEGAGYVTGQTLGVNGGRVVCSQNPTYFRCGLDPQLQQRLEVRAGQAGDGVAILSAQASIFTSPARSPHSGTLSGPGFSETIHLTIRRIGSIPSCGPTSPAPLKP